MKAKFYFLFFLLTFLVGQLFSLQKYWPLETLVKNSEIIVLGKVKAKTCLWNENKTKIFTKIMVEPQKIIKGSQTGLISVVTQGGQIGQVGFWVSDQPSFQINEKVILFLEAARQNSRPVCGLTQGKFSVAKDTVITPAYSALNETGKITQVESRKILLEDFIRKIEALKNAP